MGTRGPHDIGGLAAGPVDTSDHDEEPWQKMATAVNGVLSRADRRLITVHERRRATEALGEDYARLGYFDRSVRATAALLVEKGVLTEDEIATRLAEIRARRGPGDNGGG